MFHRRWREHALAHIDDAFDLVVIGGGITGCGILLDAAQRGLRTLLVERHDIASGTSSRSSKLIHGGLRYLKQMQFRITRLACQERDRMLALNPALVRPIRFVYPVIEDSALPGWTVDLGLWMYDRLTNRAEKHAHLTRAEVVEQAPLLSTTHLQEGLSYRDAAADDALLTLAVAATGFAHGGLLLTRAAVIDATRDSVGRIDGVILRDDETGCTHRVRAHLVVNACGVWVDEIRGGFGLPEPRMRPSRGSHLILPPDRITLEAAVTIPSPDDGRPLFLVPHPEGVLVGTTDLYHDGPLDDPRPTRQEVDYLLRALRTHFPDAHIAESDIAGAFAGLRPILDTHAQAPEEASREEDIWEEHGMLSVAGGKLTTWRATAEEAVNEALKHLPAERTQRAAPCYTAGTALAGLAPTNLAERIQRDSEEWAALTSHLPGRLRSWALPGPRGPRRTVAPPEVIAAMSRRLRSGAWWVPRLAHGRKELFPLVEGCDLAAAEVRVHLAFGAVLRLEDLLLRRARVGLWNPSLARELVPRLRSLFQQELGWNRKRWETEEESFGTALEAWSLGGVR